MIVNVNINGKEYPYCYGFGSLMLLENWRNKNPEYAQDTLVQTLMTHYACLYNGNRDLDLTLDDLVAAIDRDTVKPSLMHRLTEALAKTYQAFADANGIAGEPGDEKKK